MARFQHEATRYDLRNGIALCTSHHKFDPTISPHQNAAGWMDWLKQHHPRLYDWYRRNQRPKFHGQKTVEYYCETILRLEQYVDESDFRRIVGAKFGEHLGSILERKLK